MQAFSAGTDVTLSVPLTDRSGNVLNVSAVLVRVTDQDGGELLPQTALDGFTAGDEEAVVTVPAAKNALETGKSRALRVIELALTVGTNTTHRTARYAIEAVDPLVVGVNSFQTYPQADFIALSIPNLAGWSAAADAERINALIEARMRIVRLNFTMLNDNGQWGQNSLNYVPEGSYKTRYIGAAGMFLFNGDLDQLDATQFMGLPERFKFALRQAQVAEADAVLGGDPMAQKRQDGLISDAVGESRQAFRLTKPLELPVSRRALGYLSAFVSLNKRISR